jgi:hypothetical protein
VNLVRRWRLFVIALFSMSLIASPAAFAFAVDTVDDAIASLGSDPVYVSASAPGTTPDTAPQLARRLRDNDHLLIVMLPAPVEGVVTADLLQTTVAKISEAFGKKKIVGLTIGTSAIAAGPTLPAGTASTLMTRASTVGTNPTETLGTFIDNVHAWQVQNPEPVPPTPPAPPTPLTSQWWFWGLMGLVFGTAVFFAKRGLVLYRERQRERVGDIRFNAPPTINMWTRRLLELRSQVSSKDYPMRDAIMRVCREIDAYFADRKDMPPSEDIERSLKWAASAIEVYLKIQDAPSYYPNATKEKQRRVNGIEQFADRMHDTVVDVRKQDLADIELDLMDLS